MIIASRMLRLRQSAVETNIPVRIFLPEAGDQGAWLCRYEIDWPHGRWTHAAWGVDSVQALLLALQMIGSEIYSSEYHASGNLMFDGPGRGYGFPVAKTLRDLLIGDDAKFA